MFRASEPKIVELKLSKDFKFMYENFVIACQGKTYLLLDSDGSVAEGINFSSRIIKYGSPNDEALGGHPLSKHGLRSYGLYEVENSPWIKEQVESNKVHSRHSASLFDGYRHIIATFKDVTFEVTCKSFEEFKLSIGDLNQIVIEQVELLSDQ